MASSERKGPPAHESVNLKRMTVSPLLQDFNPTTIRKPIPDIILHFMQWLFDRLESLTVFDEKNEQKTLSDFCRHHLDCEPLWSRFYTRKEYFVDSVKNTLPSVNALLKEKDKKLPDKAVIPFCLFYETIWGRFSHSIYFFKGEDDFVASLGDRSALFHPYLSGTA